MEEESLRVDKWLWHARFFKSRSIASRLVSDGNLRLNGTRSTKPGKTVKPGDVLTFHQGRNVRVIKIVALGVRRGPSEEAQTLYEDLQPSELSAPERPSTAAGPRPTKKDRRAMERLKDIREPD